METKTATIARIKLIYVHSLTKRNGNGGTPSFARGTGLVHSLTKRNGNVLFKLMLRLRLWVHSLTKRNGNAEDTAQGSSLPLSSQPN